MQNLIVLGLVPGTGIQITFLVWQISLVVGMFLLVAWSIHRAHLIRTWLIVTMLYLTTHRRFQA
jgi:hypothetical protein